VWVAEHHGGLRVVVGELRLQLRLLAIDLTVRLRFARRAARLSLSVGKLSPAPWLCAAEQTQPGSPWPLSGRCRRAPCDH
jgi:hypothetical protein